MVLCFSSFLRHPEMAKEGGEGRRREERENNPKDAVFMKTLMVQTGCTHFLGLPNYQTTRNLVV